MAEKIRKLIDAWWTTDRDDVAQRVFAAAAAVETLEQDRKRRMRECVALYDNRPYAGIDADDYAQPSITFDAEGMTYNVTKSVIDTLVARITKHHPLPKFTTIEGDWSDQQRARKLNRFIEGQFNALEAFNLTRQCFRDACVFGTGLLKVQRLGRRIEVQRVLPHQVIAPSEEAHLADPRQLHHRIRVHCEVLASLFPRKREEIVAASTTRQGGMVEVIESWHLPSDPDDPTDGRRTLCIADLCLVDEPYRANRFPFAVMHYDAPMQGFWGIGLVQSLQQLQRSVNEMVLLIRDSIRLTARPVVLKKKDSTVSSAKFDNRLGAVYDVEDVNDFKYLTTDAVPPSAIQQRNELMEQAYRLSGVSQLSAQSRKPSGLDSAVALREFGDIESDRFAVVQQQYEELVLDVARNIIRLAREAHGGGIDLEAKSVGKQFFTSIRWSEVDLDDTKYVMRIDPVSELPRTPAGKLERATELLNAGIIDQRYAAQLAGIPDADQVMDLETARLDDVYATIDAFMDGAPYEPPEPFQDLRLGIDVMRATYLRERRHAPDELLEKLRMWIVDAGNMLEASMGPPPDQAMPPMPSATPQTPTEQIEAIGGGPAAMAAPMGPPS